MKEDSSQRKGRHRKERSILELGRGKEELESKAQGSEIECDGLKEVF
jgi:hypothetical protein